MTPRMTCLAFLALLPPFSLTQGRLIQAGMGLGSGHSMLVVAACRSWDGAFRCEASEAGTGPAVGPPSVKKRPRRPVVAPHSFRYVMIWMRCLGFSFPPDRKLLGAGVPSVPLATLLQCLIDSWHTVHEVLRA